MKSIVLALSLLIAPSAYAGTCAGPGPAALPVVAGLWWWQWDNWSQDAVVDCQKGGVF